MFAPMFSDILAEARAESVVLVVSVTESPSVAECMMSCC